MSVDELAPTRTPTAMPRWPFGSIVVVKIVTTYLILVAAGVAAGTAIVGSSAVSADRRVADWWASVRTPRLDEWSNAISHLADTFIVISGAILVAVVVGLILRRWREPMTVAVALGLEATVFLTISTIVGRSRPAVERLDTSPPTASFPSGHTGAAFVLYLVVAVIVWWNADRAWQKAIVAIGGLVVPMLVAVSRMYRGMHYLSDVVGGAVLGIVCLVVAIWIVTSACVTAEREERP